MFEFCHINVGVTWCKFLAHCCPMHLQVMLVVKDEVIPAKVDVEKAQQVTVGPVGVWVTEERGSDSSQARIYVDIGV